MICKLPILRALWHDSANFRVYVHRSGAVEIERLRDRAVALLPVQPAHTFACRVAALQRSQGGMMTESALDRLCGDFEHLIDLAVERCQQPAVPVETLHASA